MLAACTNVTLGGVLVQPVPGTRGGKATSSLTQEGVSLTTGASGCRVVHLVGREVSEGTGVGLVAMIIVSGSAGGHLVAAVVEVVRVACIGGGAMGHAGGGGASTLCARR